MSAMNWLVRQLAWEQRLVELRTGVGPKGADAVQANALHADEAKAA
jgi:hypothetical protein